MNTPTPNALFEIKQTASDQYWLLDNERKRATLFTFMSTALAAKIYVEDLPRQKQIEFQELTLIGTRPFELMEK